MDVSIILKKLHRVYPPSQPLFPGNYWLLSVSVDWLLVFQLLCLNELYYTAFFSLISFTQRKF